MSLKTATLIVIIGQFLAFSGQTAMRFLPLSELSNLENYYYIIYTLDQMSLLLFLGVLYSKQK